MPVLLFLLLGIIGVGYLFIQAERDQQAVIVLAQYVATDANWRSRVQDLDEDVGCHANPAQPVLEDNHLIWHCRLKTGWLFDGLPITVSAIVGPQASPEVNP